MKNLKSNTNEKCKSLSHIWLFATPWTISSVQSLSRVRLFVTPRIAARQASLSITNSWTLLKLMFIESVMPSSHLILCCPLLLLPPILPSIRVFSNKLTLCMRWPKYWSFSFSISPSNEHPGLISFRMDWLDVLAVQGPLKSLIQHHSSKASILRCSALHFLFIFPLSNSPNTYTHTCAFTCTHTYKHSTTLFCVCSALQKPLFQDFLTWDTKYVCSFNLTRQYIWETVRVFNSIFRKQLIKADFWKPRYKCNLFIHHWFTVGTWF